MGLDIHSKNLGCNRHHIQQLPLLTRSTNLQIFLREDRLGHEPLIYFTGKNRGGVPLPTYIHLFYRESASHPLVVYERISGKKISYARLTPATPCMLTSHAI